MEILIVIFAAAFIIVGIAVIFYGAGLVATLLPDGAYLKTILLTFQNSTGTYLAKVWDVLGILFSYYQAISLFLCVLFIMGIIYSKFRLYEVKKAKKAQRKKQAELESEALARAPKSKEQERWKTIEAHEKSNNPSDWRLSILEADILLDELLQKIGYQGDTVGERLKTARSHGGMATIDSAWEAHMIRNAIAHEGSSFSLTKAEASRVINLYQSVFQEFEFI